MISGTLGTFPALCIACPCALPIQRLHLHEFFLFGADSLPICKDLTCASPTIGVWRKFRKRYGFASDTILSLLLGFALFIFSYSPSFCRSPRTANLLIESVSDALPTPPFARTSTFLIFSQQVAWAYFFSPKLFSSAFSPPL